MECIFKFFRYVSLVNNQYSPLHRTTFGDEKFSPLGSTLQLRTKITTWPCALELFLALGMGFHIAT